MDIWAEKHCHLPKSSYIPGLINLSLTPYNRQIMKDLSLSSPVRKVIYICGTQVGKSTIILVSFGYRVFCVIYGDMLYYFPDDGMASKWSKTKLDDFIKANEFLVKELESRKRSDDNVSLKKTLIGALIIKGGKSGGKYRMDTGTFIVADDFADFPLNVGATSSGKESQKKTGEGAADKLLEDRGSGTGEASKLFINSSPKSENECPAWRAYKQTNMHHFFVKCPKCGTEQAWEFENVQWDKNKTNQYMLEGEPWIECQNKECDHRVYEDDKFQIMQTGVWKPTVETRDNETNGYRLPSVYSLLGYPLKKMCQDWLDACKTFDETGDPSEKIRHRNSKQARPWKRKAGKSVNHSALYKTMENLDPLPENCVILSCGVDLQKAGRIEAQVNGYGENERYVIDHQIFGGDPTIKLGLEGSPWKLLAEFLLNKRYKNSFGQQQPIHCAAIDIGWGKDEAHAKYFIQNYEVPFFQYSTEGTPNIFGVFGRETKKGSINFLSPNPTKDIDGFESWGMFSNIRKVALRNLFERHVKDPANSSIHFGNKPCFTEQWFKQLVIEKYNEKGILEKPHDHARNEAQDCMYISDAAFLLSFRDCEYGPDWEDFKEWNKKKLFIDNTERKAGIIGSIY
jgi:phage terminase large subunit GpA-like protein